MTTTPESLTNSLDLLDDDTMTRLARVLGDADSHFECLQSDRRVRRSLSPEESLKHAMSISFRAGYYVHPDGTLTTISAEEEEAAALPYNPFEESA